MLRIEEAASALGLTPRQVYRRVSSVRPVIAPYLRRGAHNALLLDGSALEILRAVEDHRQRGETVEGAVGRIDDGMNGKQGGEQGRAGGKQGASDGLPPLVRALLEEKERAILRLESENERLRSEVDRLLPLAALPSPRRRPWWARLLHPVTG